MVAVEIQFTAGRYHANPWGRHVNGGVSRLGGLKEMGGLQRSSEDGNKNYSRSRGVWG